MACKHNNLFLNAEHEPQDLDYKELSETIEKVKKLAEKLRKESSSDISQVAEIARQELQNAVDEICGNIDDISQQLETDVTAVNNRISHAVTTLNSVVINTENRMDARMDNIIANSSSSDGNSELIDIRTGADGSVFNSAGKAVRQQIIRNLKKLDDICNDIYSTVTTENLYYDGLPTDNLNVYDTGTFHASDSILGVIIPIMSSEGTITIKRKNAGDIFRAGTSVNLPQDGVSVSQCVT